MDSKFAAFVLVALLVLISGCTVPDLPVCGNGVCELGETSKTCPADCAASETERYSVGDVISDLIGTGTLEDQSVTVRLVNVIAEGPSGGYNATFELYDENGAVVDTKTVGVNTALHKVFEGRNGRPALLTPINILLITV